MEIQLIQSKIHDIHGQRVMLDFDLASLYEVEARVLNQSVKRNLRRFPVDFMFQLSPKEWEELRLMMADSTGMSSQFVMTYSKKRALRYTPYAFTEQGVAMLSTVLRSEKAIDVNIAIMRAFVALRHFAFTNAEVSKKGAIWKKNWLMSTKCCTGLARKTNPAPMKLQIFKPRPKTGRPDDLLAFKRSNLTSINRFIFKG